MSKQPQVISVASRSRFLVTVDASIVAELVVGLVPLFWTDHEFDVGPEWSKRVQELLSKDEYKELGFFFGSKTMCPLNLVGIGLESPKCQTVSAFLTRLEGLSDDGFRQAWISGECDEDHPELGALAADPEMTKSERRRLLAKLSGQDRRLVDLLFDDPADFRSRSCAVLKSYWEKVHLGEEGDLATALEADARSARALAKTTSVDDLVETLTNGLSLGDDFRGREVVLMPALSGGPFVYIAEHAGRHIMIYPAREEAAGGAPSTGLLRMYKALGDDTRLRILRILAQGPKYGQEIAKALDLSHTTVSHHMAILRSAGLVATTSQSARCYYRLRDPSFSGVAEGLRDFVGRD